MTRSDQQDDENFETLPSGQLVLRDKGRASFRMATMDSADAAQRAAAERHYARRFGLRDAADLRRPGFRLQPGPWAAAHPPVLEPTPGPFRVCYSDPV